MSPTESVPLPERFYFVPTEDGSLSLRFRDGPEVFSEAMHSLRGAFSETVYIYGSAIEHALREGFNLEFFSLGLGLGYNEILTAALVEHHRPTEDFALIESFEADDDLIAYFGAWIRDEAIPHEFRETYDGILARTCTTVGADPTRVKTRLFRALADGRLRLRGPLAPTTEMTSQFSCFLFDAFSSKTTPELWTEEFLTSFLTRTAREKAVFSTYACTGALKRSLRTTGFDLRIREGFSSKRDSTFAARG